MLDKEQSEVAADALLSPSREAQMAAKERAEAQHRKRATQQRIGWFGLSGFAIGAAFGYVFLGNALPAGFVGLALGFIVGQFLSRRAV